MKNLSIFLISIFLAPVCFASNANNDYREGFQDGYESGYKAGLSKCSGRSFSEEKIKLEGEKKSKFMNRKSNEMIFVSRSK